MNEYEKIALEIRRKVSKLTLQQQEELLRLYRESIEELALKISKSKNKTLNQRWLVEYKKELTKARKDLMKELSKSVRGFTTKAAKLSTETEQQIMHKMFMNAGIDPGEHFINMFNQVQDNVIKDIISGRLYKDNKTLSSRIWNYGRDFERDIQYVINQAILEKKSAIKLAEDLEKYVLDSAKRDTTWGSSYPHLKNKVVEYNAMRLARTSINHAYQNATIQSSSMNPFVEGIKWRSAQIHGRTCDLCMERDGQIFPKDDVPLDHPNGLCTMIPHIVKSTDEVATELRGWLDGEANNKLDKWYNEHGNNFTHITKGTKESKKEEETTKQKSDIEYDLSDMTKNNEERVKEHIEKLTNEYDSRLKKVIAKKDKHFGVQASVDITGDIMRLGSGSLDTIYHEFAHSLTTSDIVKYKIGTDTDVEFWKEINGVRRQYNSALKKIDKGRIEGTIDNPLFEKQKIFISKYADSNADEFMAESFARAKLDGVMEFNTIRYSEQLSPFAKRVLEIVDKYYKK